VTVDGSDNLYPADIVNSSVEVLTGNGDFDTVWGGWGSELKPEQIGWRS
jgi:hypothetical protein